MPSTTAANNHDDLHDPLAVEAVRDFPMGMATAVTTARIPGGAASPTRVIARLPRRSPPMAAATDSQVMTTMVAMMTTTGRTTTDNNHNNDILSRGGE